MYLFRALLNRELRSGRLGQPFKTMTQWSTHTPCTAFRHHPPKKDVVNQCLVFVVDPHSEHRKAVYGVCVRRELGRQKLEGTCTARSVSLVDHAVRAFICRTEPAACVRVAGH